MVYLSFLLYSQLHLSFLGKYNTQWKEYLFAVAPIILMWTLIIGGQYNVGTDYFSYLKIFLGQDSLNRYIESGEFVFVIFVKICHIFHIKGQAVFFLIAIIEAILFFIIAKLIVPNKYLVYLFIVFICFSTVFNNQMNGIRQYLSMYLFTLSVLKIANHKYWISFIILLIATLIHKSAILLYAFLFLFLIIKPLRRATVLYIIILVGFIFSFLPILDNFLTVLYSYSFYSGYTQNDYLSEIGLSNKLIKYLFIPFYLYSIKLYPHYGLSKTTKQFFIIGVVSFAIRLMSLNLTLTNRFGMYFEILMCIPLVYLLIYLKKTGKCFIFLLLLSFIYIIYILKVTLLAKGEYLYTFFLL